MACCPRRLFGGKVSDSFEAGSGLDGFGWQLTNFGVGYVARALHQGMFLKSSKQWSLDVLIILL
jgi:hypothetical protein